MDADIEHLLLIYALQNAVKYGDTPKSGTVIGTVLGKHPEFRSRAREVGPLAAKVIAKVAAMSQQERKSLLLEIAPELLDELAETHERSSRELPALPGAGNGVVMRFAPNPSGPLHLGHARASVLNDYYVRRYGGRYVLRIEDTDPRRVDPEAYGMVLEDVEWLGLGITDIVYQSDRLDIYYDWCRKLIELGGAYVCVCEAERFRELKLRGKACPCRERTVEENLELWQQMLDGEFYEGDVTVRVKTDLTHPDPAMRDYSAMRIVNAPLHPRVDATVFPLMNFSVAVDDHLLGITHVIRGKDHIANTRRQRYIFDYFGWEPPVYRHYGRMGISGVVLSTSGMREGIKSGLYTGWDDIHLGTLRAISRRGIKAEAVRNAMIDIGIGETDISFSWENLYAKNKELVDPKANRYFFVPDPVEVVVEGAPCREAHAALHPGDPSRGARTLVAGGRVLLPKADIEGKSMVRLKDLYNVRIAWDGDLPRVSYAGDSLEDARRDKAPIIQWLPADANLPCTLLRQEGSLEGFCEPLVAGERDNVVQFERIGFARVDSADGGRVSAYFAHR